MPTFLPEFRKFLIKIVFIMVIDGDKQSED